MPATLAYLLNLATPVRLGYGAARKAAAEAYDVAIKW
jgi:hypothetical protein